MTRQMNYGAAVATIAALTMSVFAAVPASAFACESWCGGGTTNTDNSVYINVSNSGTITSNTDAKASTGGNWAGGSFGGDAGKGGSGGDGGNADADPSGKCDCNPSVGNATGGNGGDGGSGGNGGDAGPGGLVDTGSATANAGSLNTLNSTEIDVQAADCGCNNDHHVDGWGRRTTNTDNSVDVYVSNSGNIYSDTDAKAKTGDNSAEGSFGGDGKKGGSGGDGGDAYAGGGWLDWDGHPVGGDANGGDGGHGGAGGDGGRGDVGGTVRTGAAESNSGSINLMNSTIVRVTR